MTQVIETNGAGFKPRKWKEGLELTEGAWVNVPSKVYHAFEAVSRSMCVDFADHTPAYALARAKYDIEPTPDMVYGLAVESYLLDSEAEFKRQFQKQVARKGSKAYEEQREQFPDAYLLTADRYDSVVSAGKSLLAHPYVESLVAGMTHRHLAIIWRCRFTGLLCKCQLDVLCEDFGFAWDLKTTGAVDDHAIENLLSSNRYLFQAVFYLEALAAAGLHYDDDFRFVIVSRTPYPGPEKQHPIRLKLYDSEDLARGSRLLGFLPGFPGVMQEVAKCVESGEWPDYEQEFTFGDMKGWRRRQIDGDEFDE